MRTCFLLRNLMFVDDLDLVNIINIEVVTGEVDQGRGVGLRGVMHAHTGRCPVSRSDVCF